MARTRAHVARWPTFSLARIDVVLLGFVLLVCAGLWMSSAKLLVSSGWRDNGRVLSCTYFTGTRVVERQYFGATPGTGQLACPIVQLG